MYLFVFSGLIVSTVQGYGTGGPISICHDPYPHHHGQERSLDPSPFKLTLDKTEYSPGDVVKGKRLLNIKALAHYKDFQKIFLKKSLQKSLSIYKTVEKTVAVVKKSCSVYGR